MECPEINPCTYGKLIYNKGGNIQYSGEKTISSTSDADKTGQLHVKQ